MTTARTSNLVDALLAAAADTGQPSVIYHVLDLINTRRNSSSRQRLDPGPTLSLKRQLCQIFRNPLKLSNQCVVDKRIIAARMHALLAKVKKIMMRVAPGPRPTRMRSRTPLRRAMQPPTGWQRVAERRRARLTRSSSDSLPPPTQHHRSPTKHRPPRRTSANAALLCRTRGDEERGSPLMDPRLVPPSIEK